MVSILILAAAAGQAAAPAPMLRLDEVQGADPMALAERLLPAAIRGEVVAGNVRRQWLPGQVFWISYRDAGVPVEADMCRRTIRAFQASAPAASGGKAPADTVLTVGAMQVFDERAVLSPGIRATAETCRRATGYISLGDDPRRAAGYRTLVAAMAAAASRRRLAFAVGCDDAKGAACSDPRRALAMLPLDALFGVSVRSGSQEVISTTGSVRVLQEKPIAPGDPYKVEVSFGPSGQDGASWRVYWDQTPQGMAGLRLERHVVIYH